jgi:hypothetical protein
LDGDVREMVVYFGVGGGFDGRVVFRVLVVLGDGADRLGKDTEEGHAEELAGQRELPFLSILRSGTYQGDAKDERHGADEGKPERISIHPILFEQGTETIANEDCTIISRATPSST